MRAEDLRLEDLVSFTEGIVSLHGRRLILHDVHATAQLRRDLIDTLGVDQARRILTRFGYFWGKADAAAMKGIVDWDSTEEWLKAGPHLHRLEGVAKVEVKTLELDDTGRFKMEVIWRDSVEAEEQLIEFGISPDADCWITLGYASGYASFCLGIPVYFKGITCRARGDKVCSALGMDEKSWGDDIGLFVQDFRPDDIQKKIDEMSTELRKKTIELARHRKRLRQIGASIGTGSPELRSRSYRQILDTARRVARFDSSVLITGESGVGKEVIARFLHDNSPRHRGQFLAVNCGALPETLLESELFGHKAGSFTGAIRDRAGLFEQANGGTILLDEIGDVPPSLQVALLRVLQEKKVRRVGENHLRNIDVRMIAATNRDLEQDLRDERFREDLFYRLRVVEIHIPPLRERPEDILPFARYFVEQLATRLKLKRLNIEPACLRILEGYPWPGNVRELENALERAAIMSEDGWIREEHLPPAMLDPEPRLVHTAGTNAKTLAEMERDYVMAVLKSCDGNRTRAAKALGIGATTLWRRLKEWGEPDV